MVLASTSVEVDGCVHVGCAPTASPRTVSRTRSPRPTRRRSRPTGHSARRRTRAAAVEHPPDAVGEHERAARARACCTSGRVASSRARSGGSATAVPTGRQRPAAGFARQPAGEHSAIQIPPSRGESLLRREVVGVELGGIDAQCRPRRRCRRRAIRPVGPSGRRTSTITPVDVSLCGNAYASTAASAHEVGMGAGLRLDHERVVEERRAAVTGGELRRELAEHEVLGAVLDRARTRRRPRTRCSPPLPSSTS